MTSESAWITWLPQQHEILAIVRLSVRDQWPVGHAADVKSDRWRPPHGPPTSRCVRARGCGPSHAPGLSAAVHGTLRLDRSSPGKFISRELTTLVFILYRYRQDCSRYHTGTSQLSLFCNESKQCWLFTGSRKWSNIGSTGDLKAASLHIHWSGVSWSLQPPAPNHST